MAPVLSARAAPSTTRPTRLDAAPMVRTVVHFTDTVAFGGAERMLLTLMAGLDWRRWRPVLVCHPGPGTGRLLDSARRAGIETRGIARGTVGVRRFTELVRAVRRERPSVFHAHLTWPLRCSTGIVAAAAARVPAIVATQHLLPLLPARPPRLKRAVVQACIHRYVAVSAAMGAVLRSGLPAERVSVIHNGIPLEPYLGARDDALRRMLTPDDAPLLLTVARLHAQKGIPFLLGALARLPRVRLAIAGDGPDRVALESESARLGISDRVRMLGEREDVAALLAACDLFVLPSLFEGLPVSVLEAMASARPVIATDVGGTTEVVSHGETGLLVPPEDAGSLADAITTLLEDPVLAARLAARGRALVEREFSATVMSERVAQLYDQLLGDRGTR